MHNIPSLQIPFAAACTAIWYFLERGGYCFRNGQFWFDTCTLCEEGSPEPVLPVDGVCENGGEYQVSAMREILVVRALFLKATALDANTYRFCTCSVVVFLASPRVNFAEILLRTSFATSDSRL